MTTTMIEHALDTEAIALEEEASRAFLARDVRRLDELFSDELLVNSPMNRVNDKRTVLSLLERGIIAHDSTELQIETTRRDGDLLTVMGSDAVVDAPGSPTIRRRYTNVWRREGGAWRLFIRQATILGA